MTVLVDFIIVGVIMCRSVLRCFTRFQSAASLQACGCQAIACLAMSDQNRAMLLEHGNAGVLLLSALNMHRDDITVQENACKAISYVVRSGKMTSLQIL